jgi:hypothetical protein
MFAGTLRSNIAPTGEYSDAEVWAALEAAHLGHFVRSAPDGLDMRLAEGGVPLAAGQRQLVALARALLKKSKCAPPAKPMHAPCTRRVRHPRLNRGPRMLPCLFYTR